MIFKTKSQTLTGEKLTLAVTIEGVEYPAGSILMTNEVGRQAVMTVEEVAAEYDEVKPRTRVAK